MSDAGQVNEQASLDLTLTAAAKAQQLRPSSLARAVTSLGSLSRPTSAATAAAGGALGETIHACFSPLLGGLSATSGSSGSSSNGAGSSNDRSQQQQQASRSFEMTPEEAGLLVVMGGQQQERNVHDLTEAAASDDGEPGAASGCSRRSRSADRVRNEPAALLVNSASPARGSSPLQRQQQLPSLASQKKQLLQQQQQGQTVRQQAAAEAPASTATTAVTGAHHGVEMTKPSQAEQQEPADVESFTGRIVYNPDGSAFIIESSDASDSDDSLLGSGRLTGGAASNSAFARSLLLLPPPQEGAIIDGRGLTPPRGADGPAIPQVVNAYHIKSNARPVGACASAAAAVGAASLVSDPLSTASGAAAAAAIGTSAGDTHALGTTYHAAAAGATAAAGRRTPGCSVAFAAAVADECSAPIVHSYRVFSVRARNGNTRSVHHPPPPKQQPQQQSQKVGDEEFDTNCPAGIENATTGRVKAETSPPGLSQRQQENSLSNTDECDVAIVDGDSAALATNPRPVILMCFLCRLSFGFSRSFVSHAKGHHELSLTDNESAQLDRRAMSAIIQGVGREKEPILSFLKPFKAAPSSIGLRMRSANSRQDSDNCASPQTDSAAASAPSAEKWVDASTSIATCTPVNSSTYNYCDTVQTNPVAVPPPASPVSQQQQQRSQPVQQHKQKQQQKQQQNKHQLKQQHQHQLLLKPANQICISNGSGDTDNDNQENQDIVKSRSDYESSACSPALPSATNRGAAGCASRSPSPPGAASSMRDTSSSPVSLSPGSRARELEQLASIERVAQMAHIAAERVAHDADSPVLRPATPSSGDSPSLSVQQAVTAFTKDSNEEALMLAQQQQAQAIFNAMLQQQLAMQSCSQHPEGKPSNVECTKCDSNQIRAAQLDAHVQNQLQTLQQSLQQSQLQAAHISMSQIGNQLNQLAVQTQQPNQASTTTPLPVGMPVGQIGAQLASGSPSSAPSPQLMHSRNSCKTLKCPKCNWHYKYQETLEIHMKEKHPENDMSCVYCLTNQPHPRLARGETYTCGYKPYRCDVCNYSTTTKGNLSIHMQSDKHINNIQELQNGQLQAAVNSGTSGAPPGAAFGQIHFTSPAVASAGKPTAVESADSRSKQASPKPKATWRCEICNYETNVARNLRIHMTSEKHTHNTAVLQQNMKNFQALQALSGTAGASPAGIEQALSQALVAQQQSGGSGAPVLASHHLVNLHPAFLQQFQQQQQLQQQQSTGAQDAAIGQSPEVQMADIAYNHALLVMAHQQQQQHHHQQQQHHPTPQHSPPQPPQNLHAVNPQAVHKNNPTLDMEHPDPTLRCDVTCDETSRIYQCCVCCVFSVDSVEALGAHFQVDRTRTREDEVLMAVAGSYICKLCSYKTNLRANFQLHCKTDKHLQRLQHVNHVKEGGKRNEWKLKYANISNPVQVRCNSCDYYTNSVHKLQLHAASPRHHICQTLFQHLVQLEAAHPPQAREHRLLQYSCKPCNLIAAKRSQLIEHIGSADHLRKAQAEPCDIREMFQVTVKNQGVGVPDLSKVADLRHCNICGFMCDSEDAMRHHSASHIEFKNRARSEDCKKDAEKSSIPELARKKDLEASGSSSGSVQCPLCQDEFPDLETIGQHLLAVHNVTREGLQRLLAIVQATGEARSAKRPRFDSSTENEVAEDKMDVDDRLDSKMDAENKAKVNSEDLICRKCGEQFSNVDNILNHLQDMPQHFEEAGSFQCWRNGCDATFGAVPDLRTHFKGHFFTVTSDLTVSERHVYKYRCNQCSLAFKTIEKLQIHSQYHAIRQATSCVICGRNFRSIQAVQKHVESAHSIMSPDEKERYHDYLLKNPFLNKEAGSGVLDPVFNEMLKKETLRDADDDTVTIEHEDLEAAEDGDDDVEALDAKHKFIEDYMNSPQLAEDAYRDSSRKYKCHRCQLAFTRQSYLTEHCKSASHRLKQATVVDKYSDPSRPHKCDICKESFTQKNILLVHLNSVSHMHKLKQVLKDSNSGILAAGVQNSVGAGQPGPKDGTGIPSAPGTPSGQASPSRSSPSPATIANNNNVVVEDSGKPFKCNLCKVSYGQNATLEVHLRSVLHQSRAAKFQELALQGQFDLQVPLIERPDDDERATADQIALQNFQQLAQNLHNIQSVAQGAHTDAQSNAADKERELLQQILCHLGVPPNVGPQQCQACNQSFPTAEALNQHQMFCPMTNAAAILQKQAQQHQQNAAVQQLLTALTTNDNPAKLKCAPTTPAQVTPVANSLTGSTVQQNFANSSFAKKPAMYKHLLESFGFDVVMQYNEFNQRSKKLDANDSKADDEPQLVEESAIVKGVCSGREAASGQENGSAEQIKMETDGAPQEVSLAVEKNNSETATPLELREIGKDSEKTASPGKIDLPELNRCQCPECGKEFSSVWVLKAHREEVHKDVVPVEVVSKVAEKIRNELESKTTTTSGPGSSGTNASACGQQQTQTAAAGTNEPKGLSASSGNLGESEPVTSEANSVKLEPSEGGLDEAKSSHTKNARRIATAVALDHNSSTHSISMNMNASTETPNKCGSADMAQSQQQPQQQLQAKKPSLPKSGPQSQTHDNSRNDQQQQNAELAQAAQLQLLMQMGLMGLPPQLAATLPQQLQQLQQIGQQLPPMHPLSMMMTMNSLNPLNPLAAAAAAAGTANTMQQVEPLLAAAAFQHAMMTGQDPTVLLAAQQKSMQQQIAATSAVTGADHTMLVPPHKMLQQQLVQLQLAAAATAAQSAASNMATSAAEQAALAKQQQLFQQMLGQLGQQPPSEAALSHHQKLLQQQILAVTQQQTQQQQQQQAPLQMPPQVQQPHGTQQAAQQQQQQQKRARTRITDDQLKILRAYFDINNSPTEEALLEMSEKSGLPLKVIKHWFRNTLFKERQRNKDSPYNFNNPPSTYLNLEEYEKTGEAKVIPISEIGSSANTDVKPLVVTTVAPSSAKQSAEIVAVVGSTAAATAPEASISDTAGPAQCSSSIKQQHSANSPLPAPIKQPTPQPSPAPATPPIQLTIKVEPTAVPSAPSTPKPTSTKNTCNSTNPGGKDPVAASTAAAAAQQQAAAALAMQQQMLVMAMMIGGESGGAAPVCKDPAAESVAELVKTQERLLAQAKPELLANPELFHEHLLKEMQAHVQAQAALGGNNGGSGAPSPTALLQQQAVNLVAAAVTPPTAPTPPSGKRANRTRFTDYQIKVLQEFFESNAYPKDDDLECLSKLLNLSPRVIVVWFQNARQKARKVYENQPQTSEDESGRFQRTPGLNYQCKKCLQVFQRYYELIKHQRNSCFKDENPIALQLKSAQHEQLQQQTSSQLQPDRPESSVGSSQTPPDTPEPSGTPKSTASSSGANLSSERALAAALPSALAAQVAQQQQQLEQHQSTNDQQGQGLGVQQASFNPLTVIPLGHGPQVGPAVSPTRSTTPTMTASASCGTFRCDKCTMVFPRFELWREHQIVHIINPALFPTAAAPVPAPTSTVVAVHQAQAVSSKSGNILPSAAPLPTPSQNIQPFSNILDDGGSNGQWKRKLDSAASTDEECSPSKDPTNGDGSPRDKRLRTTILPEQLDFLYQKYQQESNPSREMLESIARDVGLRKRVVQVWFQNTRARERKGQFRAHQQAIHKRCPFCRALFKARSALESHLATRHADLYSKGELNIDAFPDGDADNSNPDEILVNIPIMTEENSRNNVDDFRKFLEELNGPTDLSAKKQGGSGKPVATPRSAPLDLSRPDETHATTRMGLARLIESDSEDTQDPSDANPDNVVTIINDLVINDASENGDSLMYYEQQTSPGSTETRLYLPGSGTPANNSCNASNKRFRTQMSSIQIRVMKNIFRDYKTPTMAECENLGSQIGLPKRVVQVWFQNARAKEKKSKAAALKMGQAPEPEAPRPSQCDICNVCYETLNSMQDHLFSTGHIDQLRAHLQLTNDDAAETSPQAVSNALVNTTTSPGVCSGPDLILVDRQSVRVSESSEGGQTPVSSLINSTENHNKFAEQLQLFSQFPFENQPKPNYQQRQQIKPLGEVTASCQQPSKNKDSNYIESRLACGLSTGEDLSIFDPKIVTTTNTLDSALVEANASVAIVNGVQQQFGETFLGAQAAAPLAPLFNVDGRQ